MNRTFELVAISPWLAPSLQPEQSVKRISSAEAAAHVGQTQVVAGRVVEVAVHEKLVYLNLDKPFPKAPFTAVVFTAKAGALGDLRKIEGRKVEVTGKIILFRDRAEIVIEAASQLKVLND